MSEFVTRVPVVVVFLIPVRSSRSRLSVKTHVYSVQGHWSTSPTAAPPAPPPPLPTGVWRSLDPCPLALPSRTPPHFAGGPCPPTYVCVHTTLSSDVQTSADGCFLDREEDRQPVGVIALEADRLPDRVHVRTMCHNVGERACCLPNGTSERERSA